VKERMVLVEVRCLDCLSVTWQMSLPAQDVEKLQLGPGSTRCSNCDQPAQRRSA
jgi:hypothetical protein